MRVYSGSSVGSGSKETKMKGLNYTIELISDDMYRIDARITRKGKQYRKRESVQGKRNAERRAAQVVWELEDVADAESVPVVFETFGECVDYYKKNYDRWESNGTHLDAVQNDLCNIPVLDIQGGYDRMITKLKRNASVRKRGFSNATINRRSDRVRAVLNFCREHEVIGELKLKLKKFEETPRDIPISDDDVEMLLASIQKNRPYLYPIVAFSLQVPSRLGELLNLKRSDVDVVNRVVRMRSGTTKNGRGVSKPIPPNLAEYFDSIPRDCEWAFYREEKGKNIQLGRFTKAWYTCLADTKIKESIRFHDLRHYSATKLLHDGLPERVIMQIAGWRTNMLSTYYHKDSVEAAKSALALFENRMKSA